MENKPNKSVLQLWKFLHSSHSTGGLPLIQKQMAFLFICKIQQYVWRNQGVFTSLKVIRKLE